MTALIDVHLTILIIGLGQYLQDIDPLHRPSNWQLQHVLMLAGVPFFQRILEITGDHVRMAHVQSMMMSLPHEPSYEEYVAVLEVIESKICTYDDTSRCTC